MARRVAYGDQYVWSFPRAEFLAERWDWHEGEHVLVLGPTQLAGKTRLIFDLLEGTDTSGLKVPPVMFVAKPKDRTVSQGIARLGLEETPEWPPRRNWLKGKPPGYALWPRHLKDAPAEVNRAHLAAKFKPAINHLFWHTPSLVLGDEWYHLLAYLEMDEEGDRHLTQGHGMGAAAWLATQKPSGTQRHALSGFTFNSPTHGFYGRDPVASNRKRLGEISGMDERLMMEVTKKLPPYHFAYVHRAGPHMCVVEAA